MSGRPTHDTLRAQGRAAERKDVLAAIATIRAGLPAMVAAGKLDGEGGAVSGSLPRRPRRTDRAGPARGRRFNLIFNPRPMTPGNKERNRNDSHQYPPGRRASGAL